MESYLQEMPVLAFLVNAEDQNGKISAQVDTPGGDTASDEKEPVDVFGDAWNAAGNRSVMF